VNKAVVRPGVGVDGTPDNNTASAKIKIRSSDLAPEDLSNPSDNNTTSAGAEATPDVAPDVDSGNRGGNTVPGFDFQVVDTVWPELRVDRVENDRGTTSIDEQTVTWMIDRLDPAESVQMRVYTTILGVPPDGLFFNEAGVFGPDGAVTTTAQASGVSTLPATGYAPE
jgi:hypothetical protein